MNLEWCRPCDWGEFAMIFGMAVIGGAEDRKERRAISGKGARHEERGDSD